MIAILKREFKSFFRNMTGAIFITGVMLFMGIFFVAYNVVQGYPHFSIALSGISLILLFVVPILTMRSFAEERKSKIDQLLLTAPVSVKSIVFGKFLAMVGIFACCMIIACAAPIILKFYGASGIGTDYLAILLFFLMGTAYISIGMFISAITESQVIAAFGSFAILLILQLIDGIATFIPNSSKASYVCFLFLVIIVAILVNYMTHSLVISGILGVLGICGFSIAFFIKKSIFEGTFSELLKSISLITRYDDITNNIFNISSLIYYLSVSAVFVFLTIQSIQKRRWN